LRLEPITCYALPAVQRGNQYLSGSSGGDGQRRLPGDDREVSALDFHADGRRPQSKALANVREWSGSARAQTDLPRRCDHGAKYRHEAKSRVPVDDAAL
jgi:hypothetical protein